MRSWIVNNKLSVLLIAAIALLWIPGSGSARRSPTHPEDSANSTTLPQQLGAAGQASLRAIIQAGNLCGLPAIAFPCGFAENLPVALQVVGPAFSENTILAIAREFQSRTDWHKKRPPV